MWLKGLILLVGRKKNHYFRLAILPILSTSIEIGSYGWTFYEIVIYHFMIIINNNWKSFLLRHIKQINSNELWLIRLVPMEHSVPRKMKSYAPLSQVNANENQELKGIFEFGISTLHFCSPFTTCSTYMLFWWKKENPRDLLSEPPLEKTYFGSEGFFMTGDMSMLAQNIMVIPLTHKLGSLIHFPLKKQINK